MWLMFSAEFQIISLLWSFHCHSNIVNYVCKSIRLKSKYTNCTSDATMEEISDPVLSQRPIPMYNPGSLMHALASEIMQSKRFPQSGIMLIAANGRRRVANTAHSDVLARARRQWDMRAQRGRDSVASRELINMPTTTLSLLQRSRRKEVVASVTKWRAAESSHTRAQPAAHARAPAGLLLFRARARGRDRELTRCASKCVPISGGQYRRISIELASSPRLNQLFFAPPSPDGFVLD